MERYEEKPFLIEAIQWEGNNFKKIKEILESLNIKNCIYKNGEKRNNKDIVIKIYEDENSNIEEHLFIFSGDWIVKTWDNTYFLVDEKFFQRFFQLQGFGNIDRCNVCGGNQFWQDRGYQVCSTCDNEIQEEDE